jgi:hypothetical protein
VGAGATAAHGRGHGTGRFTLRASAGVILDVLAVSPRRTVLEGGPGAWEALLRLSYIDLGDQPINGGRFWRLTPMVNWYFFQTRLQFQF